MTTALLSVSDKTGIVDFAQALHARGIRLLSTGGTAKLLAHAGLPVTEVKEPVGGHAKNLHQDAGYFEHKYEGPMACLSYAVDTNIQKGALYVVPGSHRLGVLHHVDTSSHLGLDPKEWDWDDAVAVEGEAGDSIFFHVKTIHGSPNNHSDSARPVFIHRYRAANDFVVVGGTTEANRAENAKHAEEARKENQRGFMVRGRRPYEAR